MCKMDKALQLGTRRSENRTECFRDFPSSSFVWIYLSPLMLSVVFCGRRGGRWAWMRFVSIRTTSSNYAEMTPPDVTSASRFRGEHARWCMTTFSKRGPRFRKRGVRLRALAKAGKAWVITHSECVALATGAPGDERRTELERLAYYQSRERRNAHHHGQVGHKYESRRDMHRCSSLGDAELALDLSAVAVASHSSEMSETIALLTLSTSSVFNSSSLSLEPPPQKIVSELRSPLSTTTLIVVL